MYCCKLCEYETDRKRDLDRHNVSAKHVRNEFNQIAESNDKTKLKEDCLKEKQPRKIKQIKNISDSENSKEKHDDFNESKHISLIKNITNINECKQIMTAIVTELENTIKQLKTENETLKLTSDKMLNIIDKMTNSNGELHSNLMINNTKADTIINNSVINVQNYVNDNYTDVKPIMVLRPSKITKMLKNDIKYKNSVKDRTIEDYLIYYESKYALHIHLSDIIVKEYRKDNPHDQQIWSTNIKTLTFIIRKILNDSGVWSKDVHGVDVTSKIIRPFLNEIQNILIKYVKNTNDILDTEEELEEVEQQYNNIELANRIISNINNKKLHKQILKTIAEKFQLRFDEENKNLLK